MIPQADISLPDFNSHFKTSARAKPKKRLAPMSVRLSAEQRAQLECDAVGMSTKARITRNAFFQALRFTDIKHITGLVEHAVDTGAIWQALHTILDDIRTRFCLVTIRATSKIPIDIHSLIWLAGR